MQLATDWAPLIQDSVMLVHSIYMTCWSKFTLSFVDDTAVSLGDEGLLLMGTPNRYQSGRYHYRIFDLIHETTQLNDHRPFQEKTNQNTELYRILEPWAGTGLQHPVGKGHKWLGAWEGGVNCPLSTCGDGGIWLLIQ